MCATYITKVKKQVLEDFFAISLPDDFEGIDERINPFQTAHVVTRKNKSKLLTPMQFSLIPTWSKERKPKFATFNARIEDIETKPTWKGPFVQHHCVVPITNFIEPIYTGEFAGKMVSFDADELLVAAGIYSSWLDKQTGEVIDSFALIMQDAMPFVSKTGHSRSPIFLNKMASQNWIESEGEPALELKSWLTREKLIPELKVSIDRPMAKNWEKRIPKD
jgi:putative SOS response-associated peptidase YedK